MHVCKQVTINGVSKMVCNSCENNYAKCEECGEYLIKADADLVGGKYYHQTCDHPIEFPEPNECSFGDRLMVGFEQELTGIKPVDYSVSFANVGEYYLFTKYDGSVDNGGEIVSSPFNPDSIDLATMARHFAAVKKVQKEGAQIEANDTTGFHVHVNRGYLTDDQWIIVARFVHGNFMSAIISGRRNVGKLSGYASIKSITAMRDLQNSRYNAINVSNSGTVEFRYFNSTTDRRDVLGIIHIVTAIVKIVKNGGVPTNLGLYRYCKAKYPAAARYYKKMVMARNISYTAAVAIAK
jgi:hypothetical protein